MHYYGNDCMLFTCVIHGCRSIFNSIMCIYMTVTTATVNVVYIPCHIYKLPDCDVILYHWVYKQYVSAT